MSELTNGKPKIINPHIEDIQRIFAAMSAEMQRTKISCVLIAAQTGEHQAIVCNGDHGLLAGSLVSVLKFALTKCNREERDIAKGLILKEIFNQ